MRVYKIAGQQEYQVYSESAAGEYAQHIASLNALVPAREGKFTVAGYSYPAEQVVEFEVDFAFSGGYPNVNWRERAICPITGLNNRARATIHMFDLFSNVLPAEPVYIMEQTTPLFRHLAGRTPGLIGSEYLGSDVPLGALNAAGLRNEDATSLTFASDSLGAILSLDVFEHIYDSKAAFAECLRTLRRGGRFIFTVPFNVNSAVNIERALVREDGEIEHLLPPEYHGDPLSTGGVLCFRHYGWELLDVLRQVGFSDASVLIFNSMQFGYYTNQFIFVCEK
jgi:hypothetical protein